MTFKLGLIINPYAGIGGRVGLKGSDGNAIRRKAIALGGKQLAGEKTANCLRQLQEHYSKLKIYTASGDMGETVCKQLGIDFEIVYQASEPSSAVDTENVAKSLFERSLDLLLFAGGDGTARNIYQVHNQRMPVLGIPAGVKIHSGVFAVSAEAAGLLILDIINGELLSLIAADVVDIDEVAFRQGKVKSTRYGELNIPASLHYVQAVKNGHQEIEELVLEDIAAEVIEQMDDDIYYVISSGTTCAEIMQQLGLQNTLLGADIVYREALYLADATEKDLLSLLDNGKQLNFVMTIIGGQGHILGRGNHQFSPEVIKKAGWDNFILIATKSKIKELNGRPMLVDTGDIELDHQLYGLKKVITGYRDHVIYRIAR